MNLWEFAADERAPICIVAAAWLVAALLVIVGAALDRRPW